MPRRRESIKMCRVSQLRSTYVAEADDRDRDRNEKDLLDSAKDAAYVAVGLGLMGFQRAQVRRQEVLKQLRNGGANPDLEALRSEASKLLVELDEVADPIVSKLDSSLEQVEGKLPGQARQALRQARATARSAREALKNHLEDPTDDRGDDAPADSPGQG